MKFFESHSTDAELMLQLALAIFILTGIVGGFVLIQHGLDGLRPLQGVLK